MLYELKTAFAVDSAIMNEKKRLTVVLFGQQSDKFSQEVSYCEKLQVLLVNMAIFYKVDISVVQEFNQMYDLDGMCTAIVFFNNKPV